MKTVLLYNLPKPDEIDLDCLEMPSNSNCKWVDSCFVGGCDLVGLTGTIFYHGKDGHVSQRTVTIEDYLENSDKIKVHCHLRNETRHLLVDGFHAIKFVSAEYGHHQYTVVRC